MRNSFTLVWTKQAEKDFEELLAAANRSQKTRLGKKSTKASKPVGLLRQVVKCLDLLGSNPRHPGLQTHEFTSIDHPYGKGEKVFEAYVQHKTPGAYRLFWCYGPDKSQITILAITPHP